MTDRSVASIKPDKTAGQLLAGRVMPPQPP